MSQIGRSMTYKEASDWFKIPRGTIAEWWQRRHEIVRRPTACRADNSHSTRERYLFESFIQARRNGQKVSRGWFRRRGRHLFLVYVDNQFIEGLGSPESLERRQLVFAFSSGWFRAFLRRYGISLRRITRKAQKQPEQYRNMCELFL
jgi:hypothetical protein